MKWVDVAGDKGESLRSAGLAGCWVLCFVFFFSFLFFFFFFVFFSSVFFFRFLWGFVSLAADCLTEQKRPTFHVSFSRDKEEPGRKPLDCRR